MAGLALIAWWTTTTAPVQAQSEPQEGRPPSVRPGVALPIPTAESKVAPGQAQIVGGGNAAVGELPWQVVVYPGPYLCGGTLLDVNWVLTAAHCVFDKNDVLMEPELVQVVAGEYQITSRDGTEQKRGVTELYVHPGYHATTHANDIALLHLVAPVTLGPSVGTIASVESPANDELVAPGVQALVSGWGALKEDGVMADILQKVRVPIVSNNACKSAYGSKITANTLCAGLAAGGMDSCQGDSGGPLVVPDGSGWRLAGVVSFGAGCARPNYYGVYTRVSQYTQWIAGYLSSATPTAIATATPTMPSTATPTPNPTSTSVPTATAIPNPSPSPAGSQVRNGTFESGSNGEWREYSTHGYGIILPRADLGEIEPHAGNWAARLGGNNNEESTLTQDIVLKGHAVTLKFYYEVESEDECGNDTGTVHVESLADMAASGLPRALHSKTLGYDLCQKNATGGWQQAVIDVGEFADETVRLTFDAKTDGALISSMFVDDAAITVATLEVTPVPTPQALPQGTDHVYLPELQR